MADITMCLNKDCPLRYRCYRAKADSIIVDGGGFSANERAHPDRYAATPSYWQSYARFEHDGNSCDEFIQLDEE